MDKKALEQIGLSGNEIKVYLALLDSGTALVGELTKQCGIYRTNIYDALEKLIAKGLVSFVVKNNKRYYKVSNPKQLLSIIKDQKEILGEKEKELRLIIPELETKFNQSKSEEGVFVFVGKQGLRSILQLISDEKKPLFVFGAEGRFEELFPILFYKLVKQRAAEGIPSKMIYNEKVKALRKKKKLREIKLRYISKKYKSPATTAIYGDKVSIIHWTKTPLIIHIKNEEIARSYKHHFDLMWKVAKP